MEVVLYGQRHIVHRAAVVDGSVIAGGSAAYDLEPGWWNVSLRFGERWDIRTPSTPQITGEDWYWFPILGWRYLSWNIGVPSKSVPVATATGTVTVKVSATP